MRGKVLKDEMEAFQTCSDGIFTTHGLGLMWGALVNRAHPLASDLPKLMTALKKACVEHEVLPYYVPAGGFMVTPLFDTDESVLRELGARLRAAVLSLMANLTVPS